MGSGDRSGYVVQGDRCVAGDSCGKGCPATASSPTAGEFGCSVCACQSQPPAFRLCLHRDTPSASRGWWIRLNGYRCRLSTWFQTRLRVAWHDDVRMMDTCDRERMRGEIDYVADPEALDCRESLSVTAEGEADWAARGSSKTSVPLATGRGNSTPHTLHAVRSRGSRWPQDGHG